MPTLEEVHLGIGSGECTFDYDPELLEELADFRHLLFYRHGRLLGTTVILSKTPSREGITVSGYGLGFWLGIDNDGPIIESREYIAGTNRLDNGGFEILDALGFPNWWKISESSKWSLYSTDKHAGSYSMRTTVDMGKDDLLISQQRALPVGALVRASCWAKRLSGSVGRLRLRTVYEGRFDPPDLLAALGSWSDAASEYPADVSVVGSTIEMGPLTRPQVVPNPGFETGDTYGWYNPGPGSDWDVNNLDPFEGSFALRSNGVAGVTQVMQVDFTPDTPGTLSAYPVKAGEKWRFEAAVKIYSGTDGYFDVRVFPNFGAPLSIIGGASSQYEGSGEYTYAQQEAEVQDAGGGLLISLNIWQMTGGDIFFDHITATRVKGNTAWLTAPAVSVTPEKSYKLFAPVTADVACTDGAVKFSVLLQGDGRPDQRIESGTVDYQAKARTLLDFSFTPPSGYDSATVSVVGMDVLGGPIVVNEKPTLTCEDTSAYIVDEVVGPTAATWAQYTSDSTAPEGTEKVHLELIAEANGDGWAVDDVEWHRRETVDAPEDIVDDLLRDPDTDDYLVNPGTIYDLGSLQYDRQFTNLPNRPALVTLLRGGLLDAAREFRHNADNTMDVGLSTELFEHRTNLGVLTKAGLLLLSLPEVQQSVEDRLTRVKVIGQALQRKAPLPDAVVTGEATSTIPDAYDWNNNPVSRTRIVEDSSVDFSAYADALAQETLDRSADGAQSITLGISAWDAWGEFNTGDWLPVDFPEALLQDTTNPMHDEDGRTVYPAWKRVLSRKLEMAGGGDGFTVKIRRSDGSLYDVPENLIRWADKTTATLELGDVRVDFANDPQGPAAGVAFARYRAQQAR